jgi:hypothetical protein
MGCLRVATHADCLQCQQACKACEKEGKVSKLDGLLSDKTIKASRNYSNSQGNKKVGFVSITINIIPWP